MSMKALFELKSDEFVLMLMLMLTPASVSFQVLETTWFAE